MAFSKMPKAVSYDSALYCSRPTYKVHTIYSMTSSSIVKDQEARDAMWLLTAMAPLASSGSGMSIVIKSISSDELAFLPAALRLLDCTSLDLLKRGASVR